MISFPKKYFLGGLQLPFEVRSLENEIDHALYAANGFAAEIEMLSTGVGAQMLREIDASDHTIEVISSPSNSCIQTGDWRDSCYREFVDDDALVNTLHRLLNGGGYGVTTTAGLQLIALIKQNSSSFSMIEGPETPQGNKPMVIKEITTNDLGRGKICYAIRDHLTPGRGCDAMVRWNHERTQADGGDGTITAAWNTRPPWIALAHELIHGWRMVTGRVIFPRPAESQYEEAMTVGLSPYNGCKFTENAFRIAVGEALRNFYGLSDQATTRGTGWVSAQPNRFATSNPLI